MRIRPTKNAKVKPGYLMTAMTHPTLGRPLVKALAYGSSIPEIDVSDVNAFECVRLDNNTEDEIAKLAEDSAKARAQADILERKLNANFPPTPMTSSNDSSETRTNNHPRRPFALAAARKSFRGFCPRKIYRCRRAAVQGLPDIYCATRVPGGA
jgi:hypothetical protein